MFVLTALWFELVSSLENRPDIALVVIDMQRGVVAEAFEVDRVVSNINTLIVRARAGQVPVVWVQHSDDDLPEGSDSWRYIDELVRADDEPHVCKSYGDSFEDTDLESIPAERQVGRLVVTGAQTDACIRSTLHGEAISDTNLYWGFSNAPGRSGSVAPTAEIDFGQPAG